MKQTKLLAIIVCLSMLLAVFAGCATLDSDETSSAGTESSAPSDESPALEESETSDGYGISDTSDTSEAPEVSEPDESSEQGDVSEPDDSSEPETSEELHTHSFGEWTTVEESTCTKQGHQQRTCDCGKIETHYLELAKHTEVKDKAVAATCTEAGKTAGSHCSVCGNVIEPQQAIPATGHAYDNDEDEICNNCGHKRDVSCKHKNTESIPGKAATCTETGLTEGKKCKKCGEILAAQTVIAAKGHTNEDVTVKPTCTEGGYTVHTCKVCGYTYTDTYTECVGHNLEHELSEAAKKKDGYSYNYCTKCGQMFDYKRIPAVGSAGLAYEVHANNRTCTITGMGTCTDVDVVIPEILDGYTVTRIADKAFCDCTEITELTIPATVEIIGKNVFDNMPNFKVLNYNSDYAGSDLFRYSNIEKAVFGCKKIGDRLFYCCNTLKEVELLISVQRIGPKAFEKCPNLKKVSYQGPLHYWYGNVTGQMVSKFCSPCCNGADLYVEGKLVTDVVLSEYLMSVSLSAFEGCTSIKSVTFPKTDRWYSKQIDRKWDINFYAFSNCPNLKNVYYNGTLEEWCNNIQFGSGPCCNGANLYINGELITDLVIPDGMKEIQARTFVGCTSIKSLKIPKDLESIGQAAFSGCRSLEKVDIADNVELEVIDSLVFYGCVSLKEIVIPESVISIGAFAFESCTSLTNVVLPEKLEVLSGFNGCTALKTISIPNCVTTIGSQAFMGSGLESIAIPSSVTNISFEAFRACVSLKNVVIPDNVICSSDSTFRDCTALKSAVIGNGLKNIASYMFAGCSSLTDVVIGKNVTELGSGAFMDCVSLKELVLPDGLTTIGMIAFASCTSLETLVVPKSLELVDDYAFSDCSPFIYYKGNSQEYAKISGAPSSKVYYYSETEPTESGNYWHYVDGKPTIWGEAATGIAAEINLKKKRITAL